MLYEFVNPSDPIEFDAPDDETAALTALVVGGGLCMAKRKPDGDVVCGLVVFGSDGGFREIYGRTIGEAADALIRDVITACHSFRLVEGAERTSLNNWCAKAHAMTLCAEHARAQ